MGSYINTILTINRGNNPELVVITKTVAVVLTTIKQRQYMIGKNVPDPSVGFLEERRKTCHLGMDVAHEALAALVSWHL